MQFEDVEFNEKVLSIIKDKFISYQATLLQLIKECNLNLDQNIKKDVFNKIIILTQTIIDEIPIRTEEILHSYEDQEVIINKIRTDHLNISKFNYILHDIILKSNIKNQNINYFIELIKNKFKDIGFEFDYLILPNYILSTIELNKLLEPHLINFPNAKEVLEQKTPNIWIINVPFLYFENPTNWTLITHEIGHIFENNMLKVTDKYYPLKEFDVDSILRRTPSKNAKRHFHATEYQADYFASLLMGPIYHEEYFENVYSEEIYSPITHPENLERLKCLDKYVNSDSENWGDYHIPISQYQKYIEEKEEEDSEYSFENIKHLKEILEATKEKIEANIYNFNKNDWDRAYNRIIKYQPFVNNFTLLLNLSKNELLSEDLKGNSEAFDFYSCNTNEDKKTAKEEYNKYISDCIRLEYLKNQYNNFIKKSS